MSEATVHHFDSDDLLASEAAHLWFNELAAAAGENRIFCTALPGGRIAKKLFAALTAKAANRPDIFAQAHFFWGDERAVPPSSADSNYALARENLLQPLQIPDAQIHRIRGELPHAEAARAAEKEVSEIVPLSLSGLPMFDLVLLGMGEDGHIASLFPGSESRMECPGSIYLPVIGPKPPPQRVSLTYQSISAAQQIWVLASGAGKEAALQESLKPDGKTPLAHLLEMTFQTRIFTDIHSPLT